MSKRLERYWRKAEASDIAKGPFPVARFRNGPVQTWKPGRLVGFCHKGVQKYLSDENWFTEAEVYYAPDVGDGYEPIDPGHEKPQPGDEYWSVSESRWCFRFKPDAEFEPAAFYRRKIKPTPTLVPFDWEDREKFRGRRIFVTWEDGAMQELPSLVFTRTVQGNLLVDGVDAERLLAVGKFADTDKPVGKEISK